MTRSLSAVRRMRPCALRPYLFITPAMAIFLVFMIYPIFYMLYLSFQNWDMMGDMTYIGLKNYVNLFSDPEFWQVIGNTFVYMLLTVAATLVLALLLAMFMRRNTRLNAFLQSAVFMPYIVSFVSISFIWMWMMDPTYGLFNYILGIFRMSPSLWLQDPKTALTSLVIVAVWKGVGYNAIILISGLQGIPAYLYEAASLDRASRRSVFFRITMPMLSPTLFFLTLVNMISSLKVFETISIMTQGGPSNTTNTLVFDIFQQGFVYYNIGYSSAIGVVLMIIIGIMTLFYFKALGTRVHYR